MPTYDEEDFEDHIEAHLNRSGYRSRRTVHYNKRLCLIHDETLGFIQETQPDEYQKLERQYGTETPAKLLDRISREIGRRGVLDVLRKGVKDRGCNFNLTYFQSIKRHEPPPPRTLRSKPILPNSAVEVFTEERKIGRYGVVPQRSAVGDNGTEKQPHRSDGDRCGETVPDRPRSERAVIPIQAVSGSLCSGQRKGVDDNPLAEGRDTLLSVQQGYRKPGEPGRSQDRLPVGGHPPAR